MSEIRSIWDGWEKQCYLRVHDSNDAYCAMGHLYETRPSECVDNSPTIVRVAAYIRSHYDLPVQYKHPLEAQLYYPKIKNIAAIVYANNVLKLTPEDFRRIDRLTAMEEIARKLVESVALVESIENAQPAPNAERVEHQEVTP